MSNIFIRTIIAPYRIDTYNAIHKRLDMTMCFYNRVGNDQTFDTNQIESQCLFNPIYLTGITFLSSNRKWCFGLWGMLWKEKPKVVIVPEFQISSLQVLLFRLISRRKFKVVSMTDDSYDMIANHNDFTKLHAWLRNNLSRFFDDFIVVTPQVESWYQKRFNKGIWLPIIMDEKRAVDNYHRLLPYSRNYVQKYKLEGKKVLLFVGRLVALKNLHRVIDAFSDVKEEATLVIVGDGIERNSLERHAKEIDKEIIFTGRFEGDALYAWYNIASVFILASYQEAFGAVTNEALLAGCRVVISKNAGSSCLVNADNGELVSPYDIMNITNAIDHQLNIAKIPDLMNPRQNLMTVSFEERINNLVYSINK